MVVDGGSQLHVFWGQIATDVLPSLIPHMDGTKTIAEIASALPHLADLQIRESVASLCTWGLVEDGADNLQDFDSNPETVAFFRRYVGGTSTGRTGEDAFDRLNTNEIVILGSEGDEESIEYFAFMLTSAGAKRVRHVGWAAAELALGAIHSQSRIFPIALCSRNEDLKRLAELDDLCAAAELPWLRIVVDCNAGFADIGPLFHRNDHPCYRCFSQVHCGTADPAQLKSDIDSTRNIKFWISLAAAEVICRLAHIGEPKFAGWLRRYRMEDWSSQALCFPAVPSCVFCRPLQAEPSSGEDREMRQSLQIDVAVVFEDYVANRSGPFLKAGTTVSEPRALLELTKQSKRLANCPQQSLPSVLPELSGGLFDVSSSGPTSRQQFGLTELGPLLMMTAGFRKAVRGSNTPRRWAATAGNLGSVEVFLAVRSVDGLLPGYYFYQPNEHTLARFHRHSGTLAVDDFMSRVIACDTNELPEALVLFTAAYHRVAAKYGPFAYRLINLDAGVALSQFRLLATSMNLVTEVVPRWADDLIEDQMSLDSMAEQSTAVLTLRRKAALARQVSRLGNNQQRKTLLSSKPAYDFCDISVLDLASMVYSESRIVERCVSEAPFPVPAGSLTPDLTYVHAVPLSPPSTGGASVGQTLRRKKSERFYKKDPVTLQELSTMLSFAYSSDVNDWPEENLNGLPLSFMMVAPNVGSLNDGFYQYDPVRQALLSLRGPISPDDLRRLYVQEEFALAPLVIWIAGNLAAACARHGAFGHRQLLLRAGAAGNRLWMSALAMGLGGTLVAGIVQNSAGKILGLDGYRKRAILAVAIGRPRQQDTQEHLR
jgi:SagB-type dehydrogenase family enzyme